MLDELRKRVANRLWTLARRIRPAEAVAADRRSQEEKANLRSWREARGDQTLRLEYPLQPHDIAVDVGGYEGQWASDIHARYRCRVEIFEPMSGFAAGIARRFAANPALRVHACGLGAHDRTAELSLAADASSTHLATPGAERVTIKAAAGMFESLGFSEIALLKLNIEGDEFDLLSHLIDTGWIRSVRDLQVQFHRFVPDAVARREFLRQRLADTHTLTYDFPFVWENWRRLSG